MTSDVHAPTDLYGYEVLDSQNHKVGSIDGVWVDDATDRLEFIALKTGRLFGKNHVLPVEAAEVDATNRTVRVPYSEDQIKGAPSYATSDELSPDDESQIYDYFGMQRSTQTSPTGYADGSNASRAGTPGTPDPMANDVDVQSLRLAEEELQVGTRQVEAGRVRLRKVVRTEHQEVPVELRREEIEIERVPAGEASQIPQGAFQEQEIEIPLMEEQPVVAKQARVTGEVRVGKDVKTETETVRGETRSEDVDIDRDGVAEYTDGPQPTD